ncbi:MAG: HU family DNA-binding protein [Solobacterium sp.]|nr:HU family DNA-binding protein [Solobacterium sp.]
METVNKKAIAEAVAEKHNLTKKESSEIVDQVFDSVAEALKDGAKVDISGFGKFEVKVRAARTGINPQTKETIEIPESKVPGFKASKNLKDLVR